MIELESTGMPRTDIQAEELEFWNKTECVT